LRNVIDAYRIPLLHENAPNLVLNLLDSEAIFASHSS
jgi:hypothetical protein